MAISASDIYPVWKYTEYDIKGGGGYAEDALRFRVRVVDDQQDLGDPTEGEVIYEGVACVTPSDNTAIYVSINDIVADYLSAPFQESAGGRWHTQRLGGWFAIDVYDENASGWFNEWGGFFYKDYSYDYGFDASVMGLAHPITGIAAPNQWLVASAIDVQGAGDVEYELTDKNGNVSGIIVNLGRSADFNADFNADFAISQGNPAEAGYAGLNLALYADIVSVRVLCGTLVMAEYAVRQDTCKRYCLYYRNAYGGWDSVLVDAVTRKEGYARSAVGRWVDNSVQGARGSEEYANAVTEGWELRLEGLTDAQAERVRQLAGSSDVYLCDIVADTLTPLNVTATECTDKTFRNQGRKRIGYAISAVTAQVRDRR